MKITIEKGDIVICKETKSETIRGEEYRVIKARINPNGIGVLDLGFKSKHKAPGQVDDINWQRSERFFLK